MRFLLRADADIRTGTGHVMRCITLAEELIARGHDAVLRGTLGEVGWLREQVRMSGVRYDPAPLASLDARETVGEEWNAVIVDSYLVEPDVVTRVNESTPVVAIIDGDDRAIDATLYLDQNLGAEMRPQRAGVAGSILAGSSYALVRRAVRELRRDDRWRLPSNPTVLAFMGGSDPFGAMPHVASALSSLPDSVALTLVAAPASRDALLDALKGRDKVSIVAPTSALPALLAKADIVVSATGTSAWDICTMGIPAVFAAVVDNQRTGLRAVVDSGAALGVDASQDLGELARIGDLVAILLDDKRRRRAVVTSALATFDGLGAGRVADRVVALRQHDHPRPPATEW